MRRFGAEVILVGLLVGVLAGCGRNTPIPPGAQVVHVVATESEVRLDPATVHAGHVYLVLEEPLDGSFDFVARQRTAKATPGPMSADDLERLAHGDTEGTSMQGFSVGCDPVQQAESVARRDIVGTPSVLWSLPREGTRSSGRHGRWRSSKSCREPVEAPPTDLALRLGADQRAGATGALAVCRESGSSRPPPVRGRQIARLPFRSGLGRCVSDPTAWHQGGGASAGS